MQLAGFCTSLRVSESKFGTMAGIESRITYWSINSVFMKILKGNDKRNEFVFYPPFNKTAATLALIKKLVFRWSVMLHKACNLHAHDASFGDQLYPEVLS